jgi:pyruvate kinase
MGPKIRVDAKTYALAPHQKVLLVQGAGRPEQGRVGVTHGGWFKRAKAGQRILLDDGKLELEFRGLEGGAALARVVRGGTLKPRKSLNVPGVDLGFSVPTAKDKEDLRFIHKAGFDWIAASFISRPEDVHKIRAFCGRLGMQIPIISKVENAEALDHLRGIVEVSDGVIVARGDLGVELELERIPTIQRNVIHLARELGKVTVVATQMLETMMENQVPTRAEVTDVSTAALDRVDSLMLSGETAAGKHPVETVAMMDRIIRMAERNLEEDIISVPHAEPIALTCEAGLYLGLTSGAKALIAVTTRGATPRILSSYRGNIPIVVACTRPAVYHRSTLYYSVVPLLIEPVRETETVFREIERELKGRGWVQKGDVVVFVFGYPIHGKNRTNTVRRWEVG